MKLKKFNAKYKLSDTPPRDTSIYSVRVYDLANKLRELINDNFLGAAEAEGYVYGDGYVNVCVEYLGDTLRSILQAIRGRKLLHVNISEAADTLVFDLRCRGRMPILDEEIRNIVRAARNAGLDIEYDESGILLRAAVSREATFALYAIDSESFIRIIERLIFDYE